MSYLFEYNDSYEFIVGSFNITRFAFLKNIKWNASVVSKEELSSINAAYNEFNNLWNKTKLLNNDIIKKYSLILDYAIEK